MNRYELAFLSDDLLNKSSTRTIYSGSNFLKYRDFKITLQYFKISEIEFGFGLKITVPDLYSVIRVTYSMWVKKNDDSLISLRNRSKSNYDDGRNYGSNAKDIKACHITKSRLESDAIWGNSNSQQQIIFVFEIHEIEDNYDEHKIIEKFFRSSDLMKITLPSETASFEYQTRLELFKEIDSKYQIEHKKFTQMNSRIQELSSKISNLKEAEKQNHLVFLQQKEKLNNLRILHTTKMAELNQQNLITSLLQMDPTKVEIFQFDQTILSKIFDGILLIQKELVGRFVSLGLDNPDSKCSSLVTNSGIAETAVDDNDVVMPQSKKTIHELMFGFKDQSREHRLNKKGIGKRSSRSMKI